MIDGRQDEVASSIENAGFKIIAHHVQEEWHCFVAKLN
ncbi:MAG: hypothetical protein AB7D36_04705 [Oscillospiraceae bacterium]